MRSQKIFPCIIILCIVSFTTASVFADQPDVPVRVTAALNTQSVSVGDEIIYTIHVDYQQGWEIHWPQPRGDLNGLAVTSTALSDPHKSGADRFSQDMVIHLKGFVVGPYVLDPLDIGMQSPDQMPMTLQTPKLFLEIKTVLTDDSQDIRDIKAPLDSRAWLHRGIFLLGILVLCLIIILYCVYIKKRQRRIPVVPALLPHELAIQRLQDTQQQGLLEQGRIKDYYYRVSNIVRHYIEDQFSIQAPEQTTEEFLEKSMEGDALSSEHKRLLQHFLMECDLVKYACYDPGTKEAQNIYQTAYNFILQARAQVHDTAMAHHGGAT